MRKQDQDRFEEEETRTNYRQKISVSGEYRRREKKKAKETTKLIRTEEEQKRKGKKKTQKRRENEKLQKMRKETTICDVVKVLCATKEEKEKCPR